VKNTSGKKIFRALQVLDMRIPKMSPKKKEWTLTGVWLASHGTLILFELR
jgi:hypothetical protein